MAKYIPTCPICSTPCESTAQTCPTCHFEDSLGISPNWLTPGEAEEWLEDKVKPHRKVWEMRKRQDALESNMRTLYETFMSHRKQFQETMEEQSKENARLLSMIQSQEALINKPIEATKKIKPEDKTHGHDKSRDNSMKHVPKEGELYRFGQYNWKVLKINRDKGEMLLLSDIVVAKEKYHDPGGSITWENCTLRKNYLQGEFYNTFTKDEQARIIEKPMLNNPNRWYSTPGGKSPTMDKIFLLSIEEVVEYLGDSGQLRNRPSKDALWINDQYNQSRIALDDEDSASWWWLRSPGLLPDFAAFVNTDGPLLVCGFNVDTEFAGGGGVRPALWLNLKS